MKTEKKKKYTKTVTNIYSSILSFVLFFPPFDDAGQIPDEKNTWGRDDFFLYQNVYKEREGC